MSIARSTGALLGTDESTGVTITNTSTTSSSLIDILGDNTSAGTLWIYLVFTSTVTAGFVQLRLNPGRRANSGTEEYQKVNYTYAYAPINGTQKIPVCCIPASRYLGVDVNNNATGASATNVAVLYELEKVS